MTVAAAAVGLTFDQLARGRSPVERDRLRAALDDEVAIGRVKFEHGLYRLVAGALDHATIIALATLDDGRVPDPEPTSELADQIARTIESSAKPLSGTTLAGLVGARKQAVLAELRRDPRFERVGHGAHSAWRLTTDLNGSNGNRGNRTGTAARSPNGSDDRRNPTTALAVCVQELEQRLAAVERQLGEREEAHAR